MKTLPSNLLRAAGIKDPFGKQIAQYRAFSQIIHQEYLRRLERHEIPPDFDELSQVVAKANTPDAKSFYALLRYVVREHTVRKIEDAHTVTAPPRGTLQDAAAKMLVALEGR